MKEVPLLVNQENTISNSVQKKTTKFGHIAKKFTTEVFTIHSQKNLFIQESLMFFLIHRIIVFNPMVI